MSRPLIVNASCAPERALSLPAQALHVVRDFHGINGTALPLIVVFIAVRQRHVIDHMDHAVRLLDVGNGGSASILIMRLDLVAFHHGDESAAGYCHDYAPTAVVLDRLTDGLGHRIKRAPIAGRPLLAMDVKCKANALSSLDPGRKASHSRRRFSTRTCGKPRLDPPTIILSTDCPLCIHFGISP